jgi:hypothetical protein
MASTSQRSLRQNASPPSSLELSSSPKRIPTNKNNSGTGKLNRKDSDLKKSQNTSSYNMNRIKFFVLLVLCLQNTLFTVMRRYSLGVLKEKYSKVRRMYTCVLSDPHCLACTYPALLLFSMKYCLQLKLSKWCSQHSQ